MALDVIGIGREPSIARLRRAAEASGLARIVATVAVGPGTAPVDAVDGARPADALCILDPVPNLMGLLRRHGEAGASVLVAGPPTDDLAEFDRLGEIFARSGTVLRVGGVLAQRPACRAVFEVAAQGQVGRPVYFRYATEIDAAESLLWQATDAVDLATRLLGDPTDVYAVGMTRSHGELLESDLVHLALTIRHRDGSTALLGLGIADGTRDHENLLLLGDRGVVEGDPSAGGSIVRGGAAAATCANLQDAPVDALTSWLLSAVPMPKSESHRDQGLRQGRRLVSTLSAVRRSLASGRPEALATTVSDGLEVIR